MKYKIVAMAVYLTLLFTVLPAIWGGVAVKLAVYSWRIGLVSEAFAPTLAVGIGIIPFLATVIAFAAWGIWKLYEHDYLRQPQ